jgi:hypothetical protein
MMRNDTLAKVIKLLIEEGYELTSPYDFENLFDDVSHEDLCPFFYEEGETADVLKKAKAVIRKSKK